MKILITGISGFVGPHLKNELESAGHDVLGIDRSGDSKKIYPCDLLDKRAVHDFFSLQNFDFVIHLAALTYVGESWKNPKKFLDVNVGMTKNIYKALEEFSPTTGVLLVSTSDVYGAQKQLPINENAPLNPGNPYAKSKRAQEDEAFRHTNIRTIISRAFNHAGPGKSMFLAIPAFARQIALCEKGVQENIRVGNLESFRDYTDVRDVVRAYRLLIEKGEPQNIYNICSGQKRKMSDVLSTLISLSAKPIIVTENPELMRPSDVPEFWGSYNKISLEIGWKPTIPFEKTLQDTLDYWRGVV
ncbi:MAG: GDP-mannose 4,6-dehydratase [Patescibacteria group bacterium]|jgi:GDP-4-dehydro-6-deoxy-D-mannose reductase